MSSRNTLTERLFAYRTAIVVCGIAAFIAVFGGLSLFKYAAFLYDGLDLAIFNQVFWNTAHGRWFEMSIHPHSFLGDHAALAILPLSLLYRVLPDPQTLLIMQVIALGIAAWPLYLLVAHRTKGLGEKTRFVPLFMAFAWLANPQLGNAALYEFHMLALATPFLLWTLLAYERGNRTAFLLLSFVTMTFREDLSLIIASVGILSALEKRGWWWRTVPLAIGVAWFIAMMALIGHFSPASGSKFLVYYSWLGGDTIVDMLVGVLTHPWRVITHLFSLGTLEMLIGFGIPLLFFPYFAPKRLILAITPFLIIALGAPGASALVLDTHYALFFLPAVALAGADGLIRVLTRTEAQGMLRARHAFGLACITVIYAACMLGPLPAGARAVLRGAPPEARDAETIVKLIPDDVAVAASYRLLPRLSSREHLYSLHYLYLGVSQFGALVNDEAYVPDPAPEHLVIDENDYLTYQAQFSVTDWARPYAARGTERLMAYLGVRTAWSGRFVLVERGDGGTHPDAPAGFPPTMLDASLSASHDTVPSRAELTLLLAGSVAELTQHAAIVEVFDSTGELIGAREFPLGGPWLLDAPDDGAEGLVRTVQITLDRPPIGDYRAEVATFQQDALMVLDDLGTTTLRVLEEQGAHRLSVQGEPGPLQ